MSDEAASHKGRKKKVIKSNHSCMIKCKNTNFSPPLRTYYKYSYYNESYAENVQDLQLTYHTYRVNQCGFVKGSDLNYTGSYYMVSTKYRTQTNFINEDLILSK